VGHSLLRQPLVVAACQLGVLVGQVIERRIHRVGDQVLAFEKGVVLEGLQDLVLVVLGRSHVLQDRRDCLVLEGSVLGALRLDRSQVGGLFATLDG